MGLRLLVLPRVLTLVLLGRLAQVAQITRDLATALARTVSQVEEAGNSTEEASGMTRKEDQCLDRKNEK